MRGRRDGGNAGPSPRFTETLPSLAGAQALGSLPSAVDRLFGHAEP